MGKRSKQRATGLNEDERVAAAQRRQAEQKEREKKRQARVMEALFGHAQRIPA